MNTEKKTAKEGNTKKKERRKLEGDACVTTSKGMQDLRSKTTWVTGRSFKRGRGRCMHVCMHACMRFFFFCCVPLIVQRDGEDVRSEIKRGETKERKRGICPCDASGCRIGCAV